MIRSYSRVVALLLACQAAAFWPVWRWYLLRLDDSPDDLTCLVSFGVAIGLLVRSPVRRGDRRGTMMAWLALVPLGLYCGSYHKLLPIFRAALALLTIGLTASALRRPRSVAWYATLLFALPGVESMQFYLGFPLRLLASNVTAGWLQAIGFPVIADGTLLQWNGSSIEVDAPCSGVRMLWTGLFAATSLSVFYGLGWLRSVIMIAASLVVVLAANVVRSTALFFPEAGILPLPSIAHSLTGIAAFSGAIALQFFFARRLMKEVV